MSSFAASILPMKNRAKACDQKQSSSAETTFNNNNNNKGTSSASTTSSTTATSNNNKNPAASNSKNPAALPPAAVAAMKAAQKETMTMFINRNNNNKRTTSSQQSASSSSSKTTTTTSNSKNPAASKNPALPPTAVMTAQAARKETMKLSPHQLDELSRSIVSATLPNSSSNPPVALPPGQKKRGRPIGSRDKGPRKKRPPPPEQPPPKKKPPTRADIAVQQALERRQQAEKKVEKAQASVKRAEKALQNAKGAVKAAEASYARAVEQQATSKLLSAASTTTRSSSSSNINNNDNYDNSEDTWMLYYKSLAAFKEREGHTNIRKDDKTNYLLKTSNNNTTTAAAAASGNTTNTNNSNPQQQPQKKPKPPRMMTLSRWIRMQRYAKRAGTLEPYQEALLNRLEIEWNPKPGPDGSKWQSKYDALKQFKAIHGHCNVPSDYGGDGKLCNWTKSQRSQYRNGFHGKTPALSEERIQLLNALDFNWGQEKVVTPWAVRFEELKQYKQQYGHASVPWRWSQNLSLAHWVNTQRNKYRDLNDGKPSNLTQEQIEKLEGIGFQWSTGGTGRYDRSSEDHYNNETVSL